MSTDEQTYRVSTRSYACTAYVRTTLRRALEFQPRDNVWAGTEYINAARGMVPNPHTTSRLPDDQAWELTKLELRTIQIALEWRHGKVSYQRARQEHKDHWSLIEDEINRVVRAIWHSEGKYWM